MTSPTAVAAGFMRAASAAKLFACRALRIERGARRLDPFETRGKRGEGVHAAGDPQILSGRLAAVAGVVHRDVDQRVVDLERHLIRCDLLGRPVVFAVVQRDDPAKLPAARPEVAHHGHADCKTKLRHHSSTPEPTSESDVVRPCLSCVRTSHRLLAHIG